MATNVPTIGEVAELEMKIFINRLNLNKMTEQNLPTEPAISSNGVLCDEIKPHFYNGNGLQNIKCEDCKRDADDFIHYRNAGTICDNPKGACSCGAWH